MDKLKKKNKQQGRQRQGRDGVSVQMSMSMKCTICYMLKLNKTERFVKTSSVVSGPKSTWRAELREGCESPQGRYSSFCGCALGLVIGLDTWRVKFRTENKLVEVRDTVEARETEEEDKTRKQQTLEHVMTCA